MEQLEILESRPKHGGARKGAGMKKGGKHKKTKRKEIAQNYLIRRVEEEIESIVTALIEKAKEKDIMAIREALDRAWGKAREKHDITITPIPIADVRKDSSVQEDSKAKE